MEETNKENIYVTNGNPGNGNPYNGNGNGNGNCWHCGETEPPNPSNPSNPAPIDSFGFQSIAVIVIFAFLFKIRKQLTKQL